MISKNNKRIVLLFSLIFNITQSQSTPLIQFKPNTQHSNNHGVTTFDETDKLALQTFSNTVNCMFNIVQDPENKQNVISNVGTIIGGIFNFVAQAVTKNKQPDAFYKNINRKLQRVINQHKQLRNANDETIKTDESIEKENNNSYITDNIQVLFEQIKNILSDLYLLTQDQNDTAESA